MKASNFANRIRTWTLLAVLAGLLVGLGGLLGGMSGMTIALVLALLINGIVFWKSDTLALKANGAREIRSDEFPRLREIVGELARRAEIPAPRLYIVERPEPNAFATGRDPRHSAIAVTRGILELMDERQLTGVLAHELSHVKNRDTLVGTVAATLGGAVSWVAQMAQFQMFFGGHDEGRNPFGAIVAMLLAPIAALIVQLAVSRGREYLADRSGAELTGDPSGLAAALETLDAAGQQRGLLASRRGRGDADEPAMNPAFAHLYITNPLRASVGGVFATHPPMAERIARLRAMRTDRLARPLAGRPGA